MASQKTRNVRTLRESTTSIIAGTKTFNANPSNACSCLYCRV